MNVYQETDPLAFAKIFWPKINFYDKQREILYSLLHNDKTVVVAGNMLGKDFVAGFACLWYFISPIETRIVTTSAAEGQLVVLWGELERFIQTSKYPLRAEEGGPLYCTHQNIEKIVNGKPCPISYIKGMVSNKVEKLAGHHATRTLAVIDEASGVDDAVFNQLETWSKKQYIFGNPLRIGSRFHKEVKGGDIPYIEA